MAEHLQLRIGVLGGGQLGRMLAEAASPLNLHVTTLDGQADSPSSSVASQHLVGDWRDPIQIARLVECCDVITYEIEHVDADAVEKCVASARAAGRDVRAEPSPATILLVQDKYAQKQRLACPGVPVVEYCAVTSIADIERKGEKWSYPLMLKSKRLAYDGRGNSVIRGPSDIKKAVDVLLASNKSQEMSSLYLERWCPFVKELAVMVAKDTRGEVSCFPVVETIQRDNICHQVIAPAAVSPLVAAKCRKIAAEAVAMLDGAGVYGVELFLLADGRVLLNEIAPRPHNSGHYTIEACYTSQFEQHLRAIAGLPLGCAKMKVCGAAMLNVLGVDAKTEDEAFKLSYAPCEAAFAIPGASVHWYGKIGCRAGRKLGHITVVADSTPQAVSLMNQLTASNRDPSTRVPIVGVIMGSHSDLPVMKACCQTLEEFDIPFEVTIVSAHRTPARLVSYAKEAHGRGLKVIIAAAGGAAHLPGMTAALTPLPVIGVPVSLKNLDGVDSLHSIVQMPRGVPVATVAINNSTNAALLAVRMIGASDPHGLLNKMMDYQVSAERTVLDIADQLEKVGWRDYSPAQ